MSVAVRSQPRFLSILAHVLCVGLMCSGMSGQVAHAQCSSPEYRIGPHQAFCGPEGDVYEALLFDLDGAGPEPSSLIVAGNFDLSGTELTANIAAFDGTRWRRLGSGFNDPAICLAVFNGQLYAGGRFEMRGPGGAPTVFNNIARWDGNEWQPVGAGVTSSGPVAHIDAMQVFQGRLYVGGVFDRAGGLPANNIASWDGSVWRSLGTGGAGNGGGVEDGSSFADKVNDLAVFDGRLIVAGDFRKINGSTSLGNGLARFDGSNWSGYIISNVAQSGVVAALATYSDPGLSVLYIGGTFTHINGVAATGIARYSITPTADGPWGQVGTGLQMDINEMAVQSNITGVTSVYVSALNGSLETGVYRFASGAWNFDSPGLATFLGFWSGTPIAGRNGLSRKVGSDWLGIGPGLNGAIGAVIEHEGDLYAFGAFTASSSAVLSKVARLGPTGWLPVGGGIVTQAPSVTQAVSHNGDIFAVADATSGGTFRFNGTAWTQVTSQRPYLKKLGLDLYGAFDNRVANWNGSQFIDMPTTGLPAGDVNDVVQYNGALHAICSNGLYRWTGTAWTLRASNRTVYLPTRGHVWNGRLFVGTSTRPGAPSIDEFNGLAFVESLASLSASSFVDWHGKLTVVTGGYPRQFDGTRWSTLNVPMSSANVIVKDGDLVGAGTSINDGVVSPLFTRLSCCRADFDGNGTVSIDDIFIFLNAWFAGCNGQTNAACQGRTTDVDGNGSVSIDDIFIYLNVWFAGC